MGSWMSYADFLCNREHLLQAPSAHAGWPQRSARGHSGRQGPVRQHVTCTGGRPPESLCIYTGVWGRQHSSSYMLLDLPRLSTPSEHGLEEHRPPWSGSATLGAMKHNSRHCHQLQQTTLVQFWEREPSRNPHIPLVATAAPLTTTHPSGSELLRGFKSLSNGEEGTRQEIVASHRYMKLLLLRTGRCVMCLY